MALSGRMIIPRNRYIWRKVAVNSVSFLCRTALLDTCIYNLTLFSPHRGYVYTSQEVGAGWVAWADGHLLHRALRTADDKETDIFCSKLDSNTLKVNVYTSIPPSLPLPLSPTFHLPTPHSHVVQSLCPSLSPRPPKPSTSCRTVSISTGSTTSALRRTSPTQSPEIRSSSTQSTFTGCK